MIEKEQRFYQCITIVSFFGLMLLDYDIEALLVLAIGHLADIKYEIRKLNKHNKTED